MVRAGLTLERLTLAGAELDDGFDQATVSALARRFDVKVASLCSHVKNSRELKTRTAPLALEELAHRAADARPGTPPRTPWRPSRMSTAITPGSTLVTTPPPASGSIPRRRQPAPGCGTHRCRGRSCAATT